MSSQSHIEMHREHGTWRKDDDLWRDELAIWEGKINAAIEALPRLELALREYAKKLQRHGSSVRLSELDFNVHEETLAEFERGAIPEDPVVQAQEHVREWEGHRVQREAHEKIKTQQRKIMSRWKRLMSALAEGLPNKAAPVLTDH
jgi:hypothetical protein